tara:strand:- start:340 stop:621 length:282 start_codon:yes stop_codon:yes gene_type:complete
MDYKLEQTQYMLDHLDSYNGWDDQAPSHIHNLSLEVAELFNEAYHTEGAEEDEIVLLEVFRGLRRELPLDEYGKRYGAAEAHQFMHRKLVSNG